MFVTKKWIGSHLEKGKVMIAILSTTNMIEVNCAKFMGLLITIVANGLVALFNEKWWTGRKSQEISLEVLSWASLSIYSTTAISIIAWNLMNTRSMGGINLFNIANFHSMPWVTAMKFLAKTRSAPKFIEDWYLKSINIMILKNCVKQKRDGKKEKVVWNNLH